MNISVFDLFNIGIGPSSSHTVGPMRAARNFVERLVAAGTLDRTSKVTAILYGSLGATGKGHGSDKAVILGLLGDTPEGVAVETIESRLCDIRRNERLTLMNGPEITFIEKEHLIFD